MAVRATGGVNPLIEEMEGLLNAERVIVIPTDQEILELTEGRMISARLNLGVRLGESGAELVPKGQGIPGFTLRFDVGYQHVPGTVDGRYAYDYSIDGWYRHDDISVGDLAANPIDRVLATSYQDAMLRVLNGDPLLLPTIHRVAQLTLKALF